MGYIASRAMDARVLVAHQDPVIRLGLQALLGQSQFKDAVQACAQDDTRIDDLTADASVLVTDFRHGLEVSGRIRLAANRRGANPAVMVVTRCAGEHEIRSAIDAGVRGYLLSGFGQDEFVEAVRLLCQGSRYLCSTAAHRAVDSMSHEALTSREVQVLRCLMKGYVNKKIGAELDIALGTVKAHVKSIFTKFGVATRTQAVAVAARRGVLDMEDGSGDDSEAPPAGRSTGNRLPAPHGFGLQQRH